MLCLLLSGFAVSHGYAKGQPPAAGQMVLCTGHGTFVIHVDAEGEETVAASLCSECIVAVGVSPTEPRVSAGVEHVFTLSCAGGESLVVPARFSLISQARAPPEIA